MNSRTRKFSFHGGHSGDVCDHAVGSKAEVLVAYETAGFTEVGITEHVPPESDAQLYPNEIKLGHTAATLTARFDEYWHKRVPQLSSATSGRCEFFFGFETEFCGPNPQKRIASLVENYQPECIVASIHHVDDIPIDFDRSEFERAVRVLGSLEALVCRYFEQQLELIECVSGYAADIPVVVGHMDLIKLYAGTLPMTTDVERKIDAVIESANRAGLVFEINARAFHKGLPEPYPSENLLKRIVAAGGRCTLGDDSHGPEQVGKGYEETLHFIRGIVPRLVTFSRESGEGGYRCIEESI